MRAPSEADLPDSVSRVVIERNKRLSQSLLWSLQRRFFESAGPRAWSEGTVPHYITSNPSMARAYTRVVFGWLRDWMAGGLDATEPIYILELGAGSGRFAYHFVRRFFDELERSRFRDLRVTYVLSDFVRSTVESLEQHPLWQPLVDAGRVDFAELDVEHTRELRCRHAATVLSRETLKNPLIVFANYFFDGLPMDAFWIQDGHVFDCLATLSTTAENADPDNPELLSTSQVHYTPREVTSLPYDDPELDSIVEEYRTRLDGAAVLFPVAGIQCLRRIESWCNGRLLLLSADKGYHDEAAFPRDPGMGLALHGSFSMMVNYHALGAWFEGRGGTALFTTHQSGLDIGAFMLGRPSAGYTETQLAFDDAVERHGPADFFVLKKAIDRHCESWTLEEILAQLRMSGWDSAVLCSAVPAVVAAAKTASASARSEMTAAAQRVWELYYPIGEERDVAFDVGVVLSSVGAHTEALRFFGLSESTRGVCPASRVNTGLCRLELGDGEAAVECAHEALLLDPSFEPARELAKRGRAESSGPRERS